MKAPDGEEGGGFGGLQWYFTTERLHFQFSLSCIGEGNGNPLQCSCLENPRDRGAWWAAIYGVAQSRTWLTWLSSSSSGISGMNVNCTCLFSQVLESKVLEAKKFTDQFTDPCLASLRGTDTDSDGNRDLFSLQGDSGGSLMCRNKKGTWTLAGVTSWGLGCGRGWKNNLQKDDQGSPGIFTDLTKVLSWIHKHIRIGNQAKT